MKEEKEYTFGSEQEKAVYKMALNGLDRAAQIEELAMEYDYLDTQWYLDWQDEMNKVSIGPDRI